MTQKEMQAAVDGLAKLMGEKGLLRPEARISITSSAQSRVFLEWEKPEGAHADEFKFFRADAVSDAIERAFAWIASQPSPEERHLREFQTALGHLIDRGRANGIDVAFVNPLAETARALAENAITDQRGVAA